MFVSFQRRVFQASNSFYPPPASQPPTKKYDRQSFVLVVSKNDDVLKFLKVHLNRYFSHVVVHKSYTEGFFALNERNFDLAIVQANPKYHPTMEFLRKIGTQHRDVPSIVIDPDAETTCENYPGPVVVDVISPPFNLDQLHLAIRRALNLRSDLKALHEALPPRSNVGELVRGTEDSTLNKSEEKTSGLLSRIRKALKEEFME